MVCSVDFSRYRKFWSIPITENITLIDFLRSDNKIIHVGGDSDFDLQPLECWKPLKNGNFTISVSQPALDGWSIWPFVFNWADFVKTGSGEY